VSVIAAFIDSREPQWVQQLGFGGAMTAVTTLDTGDLLVTTDDGTLLAIERKTPADLLNSLQDGRLWDQLARLTRVSRWSYLLVTGEMVRGLDGKVVVEGRATGWAWAAVQGALLQAQEIGAFVVHCAGDEDYEPAVLRLAARSHKAEMLVQPARETRLLSEAERILTALPGIGLERVVSLVEYAGSPAWALQYLTDLSIEGQVTGIGPGIKKTIRKALGLKEGQELAVIYSNGHVVEKESAPDGAE
jgi:ERCC4-type nuclease